MKYTFPKSVSNLSLALKKESDVSVFQNYLLDTVHFSYWVLKLVLGFGFLNRSKVYSEDDSQFLGTNTIIKLLNWSISSRVIHGTTNVTSQIFYLWRFFSVKGFCNCISQLLPSCLRSPNLCAPWSDKLGIISRIWYHDTMMI